LFIYIETAKLIAINLKSANNAFALNAILIDNFFISL